MIESHQFGGFCYIYKMGIFVIIIIVLIGLYAMYKQINDTSTVSYSSTSNSLTHKKESDKYLDGTINEVADLSLYNYNNKNILVIDVETTGLPFDGNAPVTDLDNWPHIVSISLLLYTPKEQLIENYYSLVKQKKKIPNSAIKIHNITTEKANEEGVEITEILKVLKYFSERSKILVAHNINFDYKIIQAELKRNMVKNCFTKHKKICTMVKGTRFCGYRPKLSKLVYECFNVDYSNNTELHNAEFDSRLTAACFFYLLATDYIKSEIFD